MTNKPNTIASITLAAALMTTLLGGSAARADTQSDFKSGGQPKPKVEKVQLGVIVPPAAACPAEVTFKIFVFTNKPTTVPVMLTNNKGGATLVEVETVAGSNGVVLGQTDHTMVFGSPAEISYRAVAPYANVASNWVGADVNCIY